MKTKLKQMIVRLRVEAENHKASAFHYDRTGFNGCAAGEGGKMAAKEAIADELSKILAEENEANNSGQ